MNFDRAALEGLGSRAQFSQYPTQSYAFPGLILLDVFLIIIARIDTSKRDRIQITQIDISEYWIVYESQARLKTIIGVNTS